MASCGYCGTTILFGGEQADGVRYCNDRCHGNAGLLAASQQIPDEVVREEVTRVLRGACPECDGHGPVDVFTSHSVWSMFVFTSWRSTPRISCRGCATMKQLMGIGSSFLFGWWGIPWGVLMTPVQIARNLGGLARQADPANPSKHLEEIVRVQLVSSASAKGAEELRRAA